MKSSSGFFISVSIFSSVLFAQNSNSMSSESNSEHSVNKNNIFMICSRQKEVRWLRAFKLENGRCKTYYSKEGYVQVVSAGSYFSSCEAVLLNVKLNIEEGGFKCAEKALTSMVELE